MGGCASGRRGNRGGQDGRPKSQKARLRVRRRLHLLAQPSPRNRLVRHGRDGQPVASHRQDLAPERADVRGAHGPLQDDGQAATRRQAVQGLATGLRRPTARRLELFAELSGQRSALPVHPGRPVFRQGERDPIHREGQAPAGAQAAQDGKPEGLHGPDDSVLRGAHRQGRARSEQAGPHLEQRERHPRPAHAPVQHPGERDHGTRDPQRSAADLRRPKQVRQALGRRDRPRSPGGVQLRIGR
mmetsp:Transcript_19536/g.45525  ORF Transcript_19536/g.45525 Transcript_19536/m.45525 type:complete len:243 (-) Transcript_19536:1785-2513(-)